MKLRPSIFLERASTLVKPKSRDESLTERGSSYFFYRNDILNGSARQTKEGRLWETVRSPNY